MNISIKKATSHDASSVVRLIQQLAAQIGETSPVTESFVVEYLAFAGSNILLAEDNGQTIGLLSYSLRPNLYHAADSCLIEELITDEKYRGRGVGSALMEHLLEALKEQNCAEISVSTEKTNLPAIQFYHRHGLVDEFLFLEKHF